MKKMEKRRNTDEHDWKAQIDAVHVVLEQKVDKKPFEDLNHCVASLTKGVVNFAQVVGVFPGPRFGDADGMDQSEVDVELLDVYAAVDRRGQAGEYLSPSLAVAGRGAAGVAAGRAAAGRAAAVEVSLLVADLQMLHAFALLQLRNLTNFVKHVSVFS